MKRVINRQEETKFYSVDPADVDMGARRWYVMQPIANIAKVLLTISVLVLRLRTYI